MRRQTFSPGTKSSAIAVVGVATIACALSLGAALSVGDALAGAKGSTVKVPNKAKIEKAVAKLVGGDVDFEDTVGRAKLFQQIDKIISKDRKGIALRTPGFWAATIQENAFADRKSGKTKRIVDDEKMDVIYADGSTKQVPIVWYGASAYSKKNPAKLVVTLLPKGTDAKAWLEANWKADEVASKQWILAAVVESDDFPVSDQPFLMAHPFFHMVNTFNVDANQWYLEGIGEACTAAQKVATEGMPGRLAGLILRDPKTAVINVNSSRFATYVLSDAATNPVAAKYTELNAERNVAATKGEGAIAALGAWIAGNTGRVLPTSYEHVTETEEDRISAPWTGSLYLVSPAKRGEPAEFKVTYEREANQISIDGSNVGEFVIYMNDDLVDMDQEIAIMCNGSELVRKTFERDLKEIFETADNWGEYGHIYTASYRGFAPAEIQPEADAEEGAAKDGDAKDGDAKDGDAKDGDAKDGDAKDGDAKDGDAKDGDAKDGDAKDGDAKDGDAKDGDAKDGDAKDGDAKDGDAKDGE